MQYSVEQKIIPRAFAVDELFDDVTRKLVPHFAASGLSGQALDARGRRA